MIKSVCAWCGKEMIANGTEENHDTPLSHGICEDCKFHMFAQNGLKLRDYLNHFDVPVFIVDKENHVLASNNRASDTFMADIPGEDHVLCGIVFECDNAHLPEGCGKTVHCSGCTVRLCIAKTIETGEVFSKVPAYLDCKRSDTNKIHFLISTERFGNAVLLRVEDVSPLELIMDSAP